MITLQDHLAVAVPLVVLSLIAMGIGVVSGPAWPVPAFLSFALAALVLDGAFQVWADEQASSAKPEGTVFITDVSEITTTDGMMWRLQVENRGPVAKFAVGAALAGRDSYYIPWRPGNKQGKYRRIQRGAADSVDVARWSMEADYTEFLLGNPKHIGPLDMFSTITPDKPYWVERVDEEVLELQIRVETKRGDGPITQGKVALRRSEKYGPTVALGGLPATVRPSRELKVPENRNALIECITKAEMRAREVVTVRSRLEYFKTADAHPELIRETREEWRAAKFRCEEALEAFTVQQRIAGPGFRMMLDMFRWGVTMPDHFHEFEEQDPLGDAAHAKAREQISDAGKDVISRIDTGQAYWAQETSS